MIGLINCNNFVSFYMENLLLFFPCRKLLYIFSLLLSDNLSSSCLHIHIQLILFEHRNSCAHILWLKNPLSPLWLHSNLCKLWTAKWLVIGCLERAFQVSLSSISKYFLLYFGVNIFKEGWLESAINQRKIEWSIREK